MGSSAALTAPAVVVGSAALNLAATVIGIGASIATIVPWVESLSSQKDAA